MIASYNFLFYFCSHREVIYNIAKGKVIIVYFK